MKRVLIFSTTYFPLVGGAEIALKEITDRLPNFEFKMICAKIRPGLARKERVGNITVYRVGIGHPIDKYLLPFFGFFRSLFFRRPDVVWSLLASYGGFAALLYTWLRPKAKLLLTLQEGDPLEHYARRVGRLGVFHSAIFKRANAVQVISNFLGEWSKRMGFPGIPSVIPNGVDLARFTGRISPERRAELRRSFGFTDEDVVLVTASRLSLKNGIDDLIRSLTELSAHVRVLIAGDGEDRQKLETLVEQKQLGSRVVFLGKRGHEELPEILQSAEIFIRASLSEGLGNSFLEAMASGLPIIGTPVGGIPDFLKDGETGVFCEPRNPRSIADAVHRILNDSALRERLIQNGGKLVEREYGWEGIAKRMETVLHEL